MIHHSRDRRVEAVGLKFIVLGVFNSLTQTLSIFNTSSIASANDAPRVTD